MNVPRPRHATVVAYLALFAALGGSAYAVSKVTTNEIKRGAVTSPKIKNQTIKSEDVKSLVVREREQTVPPGAAGGATVVARCKSRERFISGGGGWVGDGNVVGMAVSRRGPSGQADGYEVRGANPDGSADTLIAQAICMRR